MTDWVHSRVPYFDDSRQIEVWLGNSLVREAMRVTRDSMYLTPGTLVYTDCQLPMADVICDERSVMAWRVKDKP